MPVPSGYYEFAQNVTLGIWVRRSGAWQRVTQVPASVYVTGGGAGQRTYSWGYNGSVQLGTGIEAFGVTVDGTDGISATVNQIQSVAWTAQAAGGGIRTALPGGSKTTVTVRPK